MADVPLPIANGFYQSDSLPISAQQCINFYPNIVQAPALSQETLFGTPGLSQEVTTGISTSEINRNSHKLGKTPYFVNGTTLYRVNSDFTRTSLGTIEGTGRVSMADNGTQLMILSPGGKGYIFVEAGDVLTEIVDVDFTTTNGKPQHVVFIDGLFCASTDSKKFIISEINNGLAWNSADVGTAEADTDDIVAPIVYRNQLMMGGGITLEGFNNQPVGADFPFQRSGLFIPVGVDSPFSIVKANKTIFWVGGGEDESPAIWTMVGNTAEKISTTAIDTLLQKLTEAEVADIFAYSYAQKGAYFVAFNLPDTTLFYDTTKVKNFTPDNRWHERKSVVVPAGGVPKTTRFRVNSLVTAYEKVLVGDSQDGRIGSMDIDIFDEYDDNIIRTFTGQPFQNNMKGMFVPQLELTMESGVGNSDNPDPTVRMARSLDGKTYTDDRTRKVGKVGKFNTRQIWYKNGYAARFELFRFTMSAKVKAVIIQLIAPNMVGATK